MLHAEGAPPAAESPRDLPAPAPPPTKELEGSRPFTFSPFSFNSSLWPGTVRTLFKNFKIIFIQANYAPDPSAGGSGGRGWRAARLSGALRRPSAPQIPPRLTDEVGGPPSQWGPWPSLSPSLSPCPRCVNSRVTRDTGRCRPPGSQEEPAARRDPGGGLGAPASLSRNSWPVSAA